MFSYQGGSKGSEGRHTQLQVMGSARAPGVLHLGCTLEMIGRSRTILSLCHSILETQGLFLPPHSLAHLVTILFPTHFLNSAPTPILCSHCSLHLPSLSALPSCLSPTLPCASSSLGSQHLIIVTHLLKNNWRMEKGLLSSYYTGIGVTAGGV